MRLLSFSLSSCISVRPQGRRNCHAPLASFLQRSDLPFADALAEEAIHKAFDDEGASFADDQDAVYTPAVTLWAFLSQVLFKNEQRSCVAAVARVVVLLVSLERGSCSNNTGGYGRARGKLSEKAIHRLTIDVAEGCESQADAAWLWHGRHVYLVDGTTASMPDTPENQEAYPQSTQQQPGLGFPMVRVVVLLSLATGMLKAGGIAKLSLDSATHALVGATRPP